ncbi:hypothetical protein NC652_012878 [Populus alba x Populus x berolinensis]|nr:hypothetical protein NC652_012878 [Populus alba x Populus x berolinensis]
MQQAKLFLTVYGCCALADSAEFNRLVLQSGPLDSVNLKNEVEKLTDAKIRVIHSIEEAGRNGEEIEVDVENWLRSVDGVIQGGGGVVGDESSKKCFMGLCPDLKIRYRLGKAAKKELTVVADLRKNGEFDRVSYRAAPLDADNMPKDLFLFFQKLKTFRIFIGDGWDWSVKYATSRTLKLKLNAVIQLEEWVKALLKITEELHLQELNGVKSILNDLDGEEITIIDCKIMEEVVVAEESESDAADGEPIEFTQLRRLTLQCLPQLTSFHSNVEESSVSQRRQKLLLAGEARSKEIVAGNELGTSMSLFNTKVLFPNLEDLKLSSIKVEKIWHDQPAVQLPCVKNLASIVVENCSNLNYLLTSSMVGSLAQLVRPEICNCKSMEEIVVQEGIGEGKMLFPKLLILELTGLPKLTRFCTSNLLECHSLKVLMLGKCPELKEFISTPSSADVPAMSKPDDTKSALFDDKVAFPDLELFLCFEMDNLKVIWHSELHPDSFCKLKILHVGHGKNLLNIFPSSMLGRFHNIESLIINNCDSVEEIFDLQALVNVEQRLAVTATQLRVVRLWNLPHLKHVWNRDPQGIVSTQLRVILFPNLEDLKLSSIKVEKIWHDQPAVQPPCVKNLASIAVENCSNLNYLLTSSMVESLAQLKSLEIFNCKSMEEIVVPEGIGEGKMMSKMLFPKLLILSLIRLPKLTRFCTSNLLECHSLKVLTVGNCPELKEFISIPSSADVPVMSKPDNTKSALFDDKVAFPDLEEFLIAETDNLKVIWHSELHPDSLCKLKTLHVVAVKNLLNIFPSSMLGRFHNLESVTIAACDSVEEIFDLQALINVEQRLAVTATQLRVVRLTNLSKLKHVWNRDPQGILSFHNLCTVRVQGCLGLRSLFPASIALNLVQLEELLIENCGVEEIVAKDEGLEEGPEFMFPKVTYLHLVEVPELKRFYPGIHTSEWPRLKKFWVYHCKKIEIFPSEIKCSQEPCREDHMDIEGQQPLLSFRKV